MIKTWTMRTVHMYDIITGALNAQLALRDKIQIRSMLSEIRMAHTKGEWTSGYCKTGAQANKPHFHEMLMRQTPWRPFTFHFKGHQMSGVAISWLLVKRAEEPFLRHIINSVRIELSDCLHLKYPERSFSGLSTFSQFRPTASGKGGRMSATGLR